MFGRPLSRKMAFLTLSAFHLLCNMFYNIAIIQQSWIHSQTGSTHPFVHGGVFKIWFRAVIGIKSLKLRCCSGESAYAFQLIYHPIYILHIVEIVYNNVRFFLAYPLLPHIENEWSRFFTDNRYSKFELDHKYKDTITRLSWCLPGINT